MFMGLENPRSSQGARWVKYVLVLPAPASGPHAAAASRDALRARGAARAGDALPASLTCTGGRLSSRTTRSAASPRSR